MNKQLAISLVPSADISIDPDRITLTLEQEDPPIDDITLRDVYDMWLQAREGYSARNSKPYDCKVKFDETSITFSVGFYVWPLPIETPYNLSANQGVISEGVRFDREVENSITFPLNNKVTFDKKISNVSYYWETPNIDKYGVIHASQPIALERDSLLVNNPYFGVARVSYVEEGFRHEVELIIDNVDENGENIQIDDINITITAQWVDEKGKDQTTDLKLGIPKCVEQALKLCKANPNMVCQSCSNFVINIYYNTCGDDEILEIRKVDLEGDGGSWCLPLE